MVDMDCSVLRGEMRCHEPMRKHVTWRAGGPADRFYLPADLDDFAQFLRLSQDEPVYVIGLGSNLLVREGGVRGTVVALHARLNDLRLIEYDAMDGLVYAGAGVACAKIARFAANHRLAGAEFLAGIPGTLGGALAMNAGCYGSEAWQFVDKVEVIKRDGLRMERLPQDYEVGYRSVKLLHEVGGGGGPEWFAGGCLRFKQGDAVQSREKIKQLLAQRIRTQPLNSPNAGSVFRNPPGDHAARLIEACHLKGVGIGDAMVSPKHANFIVNTGTASAADIEALILLVRARVRKATGIDLIPEIRIIGDARRLT
ncbi:MAG: UDP-N-acetylmuramate dehydrogenase [Nitrosomonas sp.]|nr:MAG: UDP-N-acetylmuramate dehydrogenase [Nitrosomonas sp.]